MADSESTDLGQVITPYLDLLIPFVHGEISAEKFEQGFLPRYLKDESDRSQRSFEVFDRFFTDVDEFVADPHLRAQVSGIGPDELRQLAQQLLSRSGLLGVNSPSRP